MERLRALIVSSAGAEAFLAANGEFAAGIMVSASHNPAEDNGLKVLDAEGLKLDDSIEDELERLIWRTEELGGVGNRELGELAPFPQHDVDQRRAGGERGRRGGDDGQGVVVHLDEVARVLGALGAAVLGHEPPDVGVQQAAHRALDACAGAHVGRVRIALLVGVGVVLAMVGDPMDRRALERDEAAIEHWRKRTWPALKKTLVARED